MPDPEDARDWPEFGDMPPEDFRAALHRVADWIADYRASVEDLPVSPDVAPGDLVARLPAAPPEEAAGFEEIFRDFQEQITPGLVHWGHPSFLGYFGSTTTAPGIIGEMLAAALNVSAMTWRTSPAATELETVVLDWLRQMLGLPSDFTGIVYDTASVAVLHALAAARESLALDARAEGLGGRPGVPALRVYASEQAHSSVEKAANVLGIGERNVRRIECDEAFRMNVAALERAMDEDARARIMPLAVVATVGTTSTTSIDPVERVAALCRERGVWLHVDAAYGGAMALLPEGAHVLAGVEAADSIVVNPHKWLFVPLDFSALYVRRPELLRATFSLVPEYLRGDAEQSERNYMDYGIQLGRRFRALKAWMVFRSLGRSGIVARIREHIRLARLFASWLEADARFELLAPVTMAVVCFRVARFEGGGAQAMEERGAQATEERNAQATEERSARGVEKRDEEAARDEASKDEQPSDEGTGDERSGDEELNERNRRLVEAVNATGEAYLTHTVLRGRVAVRLAVGNVLTTERHLARVYELLVRLARA